VPLTKKKKKFIIQGESTSLSKSFVVFTGKEEMGDQGAMKKRGRYSNYRKRERLCKSVVNDLTVLYV
jgi:hypothetical protein